MNIVDKIKGKSSQTKDFLYAIDSEPSLLGDSAKLLEGWAIGRSTKAGHLEESAPSDCLLPKLQLVLESAVVFEFYCQFPRLDVFKSFPEYSSNLVSGFRLYFPLDILAHIPTGRLELQAVANGQTHTLWQWVQGVETAKTKDYQQKLISYLQQNKADVFFDHAYLPKASSTQTPPLHLVLESNGNYSRFKQLAHSLFSAFSAENLASVTILAEAHAEKEILRSVLAETAPSSQDVPLYFLPDESTAHWQRLTQQDSAFAEHLVLWAHESAGLDYVNLAQLVSDYLSLQTISVLMPACYGQQGALSAPAASHLAALRVESSVNGADVPALYPVNALGPVWLTTLGFLNSLDEKSGVSKYGSRLPLDQQLFVPRNNTSLFHLDLRQCLLSSDPKASSLTQLQLQQANYIVEHELSWNSREVLEQSTILFVAPEHWSREKLSSGYCFCVSALADRLRQAGNRVIFVHDTEVEQRLLIGGFSSAGLDECLSLLNGCRVSWVFALDWEGTRTANVLKYFFDCKVARIVPDKEHLAFRQANREKYELALQANKGLFLPLAFSENVLEELFPKLFKYHEFRRLALSYNQTAFSNLPLPRDEAQIICLISEDLSEENLLLLKNALQEVKAKSVGTRIVIVGESVNKAAYQQLTGAADSSWASLDAESLSTLYNQSSCVLQWGEQRGLNFSALEAMACGCIPVVSDKESMDYLSAEAENHICCSKDVSALADSLSSLLANTSRRQQLRENTLQTAAGFIPQSVDTLMSDLSKHWMMLTSRLEQERAERKGISIIIPIYCALDASIMCLRSVLEHAPESCEIVIVNDASDSGTTNWLRNFAEENVRVTLVDLEKNVGFVQACTAGLAHCAADRDVLLLNSDVVITSNSVQSLKDAAYSRFDIGLASALSTNSPHLEVSVNYGDSLEQAAETIRRHHEPTYPTVVTPEGQMLYIRRWAIDSFGFFDPVFNRGFCEESDMCMRMFLGGVDMICADNVLILHRRSVSFGTEVRTEYVKQNRPIFDGRWRKHYEPLYKEFRRRDPIAAVRRTYNAFAQTLEGPKEPFVLKAHERDFALSNKSTTSQNSVLGDCQVVFILPGAILGGGSLSVMQHANELLLRGIEARVLSLGEPKVGNYPQLAPIIPVSVEQLYELDWTNQKVIATFWTTSYLVKGLSLRFPELDAYYYIQDYEPWFYSRPEEYLRVREAEKSYELGLKCVAKTHFLQDLVKEKHGIDVQVITPGIDHSSFYPGEQQNYSGRPRMAALFRPRTTRRGNKECIELIRRLHRRVPELSVVLFGDSTGLDEDLLDFVELRGRLVPAKVAELYRNTDVVVDMSYWHGFGRMGIESMACGAVPILSQSGGVLRYAKDKENCLLVDLEDMDTIVERSIVLLKDKPLRLRMREAALQTASEFTEDKAATDWMKIWGMSEGQERDAERVQQNAKAPPFAAAAR